MQPVISIVVPTRNRRESLLRLLRALESEVATCSFEVIVVDDGSSDDTLDALHRAQTPFPLRVVRETGKGPAHARNAGAAMATGPFLLFLDDDVEPLPGVLAAHQVVHQHNGRVIGIADYPPVVDDTYYGVILRGWWEALLEGVYTAGHRLGFRSVLSGHLSVPRDVFTALGGFDTTFRAHEDWEFGYRALLADVKIVPVPHASARHHESHDLTKAFRRKFDEGVADYYLLKKYPELAPELPLSRRTPTTRAGVLKRMAFVVPSAGDRVARTLERLLPIYEGIGLRFRWRALLESILAYWYWRGVASVMPDRRRLARMVARTPDEGIELTIDLAMGVERAAEVLDAAAPRSLRLVYGNREVGVVRHRPGCEPLRGIHLRALLRRDFRHRLGRVLSEAGVAPMVVAGETRPSSGTHDRLALAQRPPVRDEELPADRRPDVDVQPRSSVPPIHHVA